MYGKGVMYFFNGVGGYWKGNFGDVGMLLIEWIKSYNLVGFLFWVFLVMSLMECFMLLMVWELMMFVECFFNWKKLK